MTRTSALELLRGSGLGDIVQVCRLVQTLGHSTPIDAATLIREWKGPTDHPSVLPAARELLFALDRSRWFRDLRQETGRLVRAQWPEIVSVAKTSCREAPRGSGRCFNVKLGTQVGAHGAEGVAVGHATRPQDIRGPS